MIVNWVLGYEEYYGDQPWNSKEVEKIQEQIEEQREN